MPLARGFCDLNIMSGANAKKTVLKAASLGYRTVAINTVVSDPEFTRKAVVIPEPSTITIPESELRYHKIQNAPVILTRLTINQSSVDTSYLAKFKAVIIKYDIVALCPRTGPALAQCITSPPISYDILSLPVTLQRTDFKVMQKNKLKGLSVELMYGLCLNPATSLLLFKTAHSLHQICRLLKVLVTSGAQSPEKLRHPYDVMNLSRFFGLTEGAAKNAITAAAHDVVYCALERRKGTSKCVSEINVLESKNTPEIVHKKFKGLDNARSLIAEDMEVEK